MSLINFNARGRYEIAVIGNSLIIADSTGTPDYINGAYITTSTTLTAGAGYPAGTTLNPAQNSSSVVANIQNAGPLYAQYLVWVTSTAPSPPYQVTLKVPNNLNPQVVTADSSEAIGNLRLHVADIIPFIPNVNNGTYTVGNVPGPTIVSGTTQSALSWFIVFVYVSTNLTGPRYLNFNIGLNYISANNTNFVYQFPSFWGTPTVTTPNQYYLSTYSFGNINNGSNLSIGTTSIPNGVIGQPGAYSGTPPYISASNAVSGNILFADTGNANLGSVDTTGTFGIYNKNTFPGASPVPYARTNFNLMGLNVSNLISINQPNLYTNTFVNTTNTFKAVYNTSNFYLTDLLYPLLEPIAMTTNRSAVGPGETLTYTVRIPNTGTGGNAINVVMLDTLPQEVDFIPGTVKINGITSLTANPSYINLDTISTSSVVTINFDVKVKSTPPLSNTISNTTQLIEGWIPLANLSEERYVSSGSSNVNIVYSNLSSTKTVSKNYVGLNDVLTFTIPITNTGNTTTNYVQFIDTIPAGTTYVANSLTQDGSVIGTNPQPPGAQINNIGPNATSTVSFKVTVTSIPSTGKIINSATTSFNYVIDNTTTPNVLGNGYTNTNIVSTTISSAALSILKSSNKSYATLGDVITYTLTMQNLGTTITNSIVLIDTIPAGTNLVPNSIHQDGSLVSGNPNPPGININNIAPNTISTLTYQVTLVSIPSVIPINNAANLIYSYTIDSTTTPNITGLGVINSNIISTTLNYISLSSSKFVNKDYVDLYGLLTFTIPITNNGSTTTNMLIFIDTIPQGTSFVSNSLQQDGNTISGSPNPPGVSLNNIGPGATSTVTFNVTAYTIPSSGKIVNSATTSFNYVIDPTTLPLRIGYGFTNTNITTTTISHADLSGTKVVDKSYATLGDILTYTIPISNTGTATATNVTLVDTTPSGLVFIPGSLKVNGISTGGDPNPPGASLNNIGLNTTDVISYQVMITTIPSINPIQNSGSVQYSYVVNPSTTPVITGSDSLNTNIVSTVFNYTSIVSTKIVNKNYSDINSLLTYTISLYNTGNVTANNVVLMDTIPASATFVPNSLLQDGVIKTGNPNPPGISLDIIKPNTLSTVSFNVLVNTIPTTNNLRNSATTSFTFTIDPSTNPSRTGLSYSNTNITTTTILSARLSSSKIVNLGYATFDNVLTYTIPILNTGNTTANNIIFSDTIPYGVVFLPGTFSQDGSIIAGNPNPPGVSLNDIAPNSISTVVFRAKVTTIPSTNTVKNSATTTFNYIINPSTTPNLTSQNSSNTNVVTTTISAATFATVTLTSSASFATCDDILTFTISIPNTGNATAYNVNILDTIPNGMSFISNSVTINGVTIPNNSPVPPGGINIGTIPAGAYYVVTFKLKIDC